MKRDQYSFTRKSMAWAVHTFTASGLVAGFLAILAIQDEDWRSAMAWLVISLIIDGIDGTFARLVDVQKVLPEIDGKTIDYVIDFATYAIIPAYFIYEAPVLAEAWRLPCAIVILLVSALYYGKEGMVSEDMYFVGFPVMWNMVAFYLVFITDFGETINAALIFIFAIMHFLPIKFAYPSRNTGFKTLTLFVSALLFVVMISIIYLYPQKVMSLNILAIAIVVYYALLAVYNTWIEQED